jgi:hypothetical protein
VDYEQIEIHTGNVLENYNRFKVINHAEWMYELNNFKKQAVSLNKNKKITKHFGCLIGRSNINRLIMASHLWGNHSDKTLMTYHFTPGHDFHREHLGLEDIIYYFGVNSTEFEHAVNFLKQGPIIRDTVVSYPIANQNAIDQVCNWYQDFFVDIVCETFSNGQVFFLTEKFWRSVATKTPFIVQGSQHTLYRLRQLGFKTFNQWWDEGYDEDPYLYSLSEIKKVIDNLARLPVTDLDLMYNDMQDVLDHNYNVMINLTYKDLANVK